jgi:hypothetical protein
VKWRAISTVLRDILCMGLGAFVMLHEELSGQVHPALLAAAAPLLGVPPAIALWHTARGPGKREREDTTTRSSRSRSPSR